MLQEICSHRDFFSCCGLTILIYIVLAIKKILIKNKNKQKKSALIFLDILTHVWKKNGSQVKVVVFGS